ncbi:MAG: hypothetical protein NTY96_04925 [Bacteroidetes bacterium]|nr:hypothetical protein [Bacteroidota bacterium]
MYPLIYHRNLTTHKWYSYPRHQQLLMIANEMNRAQNALLKQDQDSAIHAWERVFELTDLTVSDPKNPQLMKELLRFRELLGEVFTKPDTNINKLLMDTLVSLDPQAYNMLN